MTISIPIVGVTLEGDLVIPRKTRGMVVFAHGSGSSRHSPRNKYVAEELHKAGFGTLLFDLLTEKEDEVYERRFDIDLLTVRLIAAIRWLAARDGYRGLPIGLFGASTGAAAALEAAAALGGDVSAMVSRGGRPDLAMSSLGRVTAPTLLIVGGEDDIVIGLNREAAAALRCVKHLAIVPGATHLFEESGTLEEVSHLAVEWFRKYLA